MQKTRKENSMPTGRKPTPLKLVDNAKARHTKETLDGRQNGKPKGMLLSEIKTDIPKTPHKI